MSVTFSHEKTFLWYKLVGNHTFEETISGFKEGLENSLFKPGQNILIDARDSKEKRTRNELATFADFFGARAKTLGPRCALLVNDKNPAQEDYERILASFSHRYHVEFFVFSSPKDAIQWLTEKDKSG